MKFQNPLIVVTDLSRSVAFYREVLGLEVVLDFGANVTMTGGICLQTKDSWQRLLELEEYEIVFGGNHSELYFEEDNFDQFIQRLSAVRRLHYVHQVKEHRWGQRVVRFYDPDLHVIEVGENMKSVCRRFLDSGMTPEETALRMDVPITYIFECMEAT